MTELENPFAMLVLQRMLPLIGAVRPAVRVSASSGLTTREIRHIVTTLAFAEWNRIFGT
jgi:hypothetical protein